MAIAFSVHLISSNNLIPIQSLISSSSFIKIPMSISISYSSFCFKDQSCVLEKSYFNFFQASLNYKYFRFLCNDYLKTIARDLILIQRSISRDSVSSLRTWARRLTYKNPQSVTIATILL